MPDSLCPFCGWPIGPDASHHDDRVNGFGTITCKWNDRESGNYHTLITVHDPPPRRIYFDPFLTDREAWWLPDAKP